jgi:hypothetical protein
MAVQASWFRRHGVWIRMSACWVTSRWCPRLANLTIAAQPLPSLPRFLHGSAPFPAHMATQAEMQYLAYERPWSLSHTCDWLLFVPWACMLAGFFSGGAHAVNSILASGIIFAWDSCLAFMDPAGSQAPGHGVVHSNMVLSLLKSTTPFPLPSVCSLRSYLLLAISHGVLGFVSFFFFSSEWRTLICLELSISIFHLPPSIRFLSSLICFHQTVLLLSSTTRFGSPAADSQLLRVRRHVEHTFCPSRS